MTRQTPQRRTTHTLFLCLLSAALLAPLATTGCKAGSSRDKWKADAGGRWNKMRSHVMLETATNQFETGQLDSAEKTLLEALAVDQSHPGLFTLAGRVFIERGELERANQCFAQAILINDKNADPYYYQGLVYQRWNKTQPALERYRKAQTLDPDNATRTLAVAETLVALNRLDEAQALLESKLTKFDTNAAIRIMLGHICNLQKQPDQAIHYFRAAITLAPEDSMLQEELARTLIKAGQPDEACTVLRTRLAQSDHTPRVDLMRLLAQAELACGRTPEARQVYIDLTRIDGSQVGDWIKLGELSWKMDDAGGTLIAAQRAMDLAPTRSEGFLMAGMVWQKREQLDNALRLYDHAAKLTPQDPTPLLMRGMALQQAKKLAAAELAFNQALKIEPANARTQKLLDNVKKQRQSEASTTAPITDASKGF